MTKDEALKLAEEALTDLMSGWKYIRQSQGDLYGVGWDRAQDKGEVALTAIREAMEQPTNDEEISTKLVDEQQEEQKPVAWGYIDAVGSFIDALSIQHGAYQTPLYTHPAPLEQPVKQEPIGFFNVNDYGNWEQNEGGIGEPFYEHPAPRTEWVDLTDREIEEEVGLSCCGENEIDVARIAIAAFKEKNK